MIIISGQSFHTFFFRGRLHLKINCANNKLTCEGKWRLIKMSRSQLFLIVSCFVGNSIFPSGQTQSLIPSIPIWSQYSSNPFHYHGGHPHQRSKKGRLFFNKFGYYVIIFLPNTVFPSLAIRTCFFCSIVLSEGIFSETPPDPNFGGKLGLVWVWVGEHN